MAMLNNQRAIMEYDHLPKDAVFFVFPTLTALSEPRFGLWDDDYQTDCGMIRKWILILE